MEATNINQIRSKPEPIQLGTRPGPGRRALAAGNRRETKKHRHCRVLFFFKYCVLVVFLFRSGAQRKVGSERCMCGRQRAQKIKRPATAGCLKLANVLFLEATRSGRAVTGWAGGRRQATCDRQRVAGSRRRAGGAVGWKPFFH